MEWKKIGRRLQRMDREGRKTGRRELKHGTRETERMGEKGWNGCRSSYRGTSLRGGFPHGSGNDDDSRSDMRQTHCAAKPNAARCDERCSALRWTMHRTASFHPNHSHEARSTQQPNPTAAHRSAKTTSPLPVHAIGALPLAPKRHLLSRLLRTARQAVKRNTRNSKTGRSGPRGRTKKDVRQNEAGHKTERRKQDDRTERAKRPNEERRATGRSGPKD